MTTWFTSDTHFGHTNIIKYNNRPFQTRNDMDLQLIANWNSVVAKDDTVYHLGDFCFCTEQEGQAILDSLKGKKHLISGNHDKVAKKLVGWESIQPMLEVSIDGKLIILCHYALRVWNKSHHGSWHLYGHSHGSLPDDPNSLSFDAGVDCHNYQMLNMDAVRRIMKTKTWKAVDHHAQ